MEKQLYICHYLMKNSLVQHFYIMDPSLDVEIHYGHFSKGNIINFQSIGYCYAIHRLCDTCYNTTYEIPKFDLYPINNCESTIKNKIYNIPFSLQSFYYLMALAMLVVSFVTLQMRFLLIFIVIFLTFYYIRILNLHRVPHITTCKHVIKDLNIIYAQIKIDKCKFKGLIRNL